MKLNYPYIFAVHLESGWERIEAESERRGELKGKRPIHGGSRRRVEKIGEMC